MIPVKLPARPTAAMFVKMLRTLPIMPNVPMNLAPEDCPACPAVALPQGTVELEMFEVEDYEVVVQIGRWFANRAATWRVFARTWSATAADGSPVVLKYYPDRAMADRNSILLPGLNQFRGHSVPIPDLHDRGRRSFGRRPA